MGQGVAARLAPLQVLEEDHQHVDRATDAHRQQEGGKDLLGQTWDMDLR